MEKLFSKILCPTDFSDLSAQAINKAAAFSVMMGAELYIAHIIIQQMADIYGMSVHNDYTDKGIVNLADEKVREFTDGLITDVKYEVIIKNDIHIYSGLLDIVQDNKIDLIIMATHGRKGIKRRLLGSATEAVIRHADCSVLALRDKE
ncbi:MAG: universal stress protein [Desulfobacteraceae bacterium]|jgi:nucleotide-binding universal stress UspA family protein